MTKQNPHTGKKDDGEDEDLPAKIDESDLEGWDEDEEEIVEDQFEDEEE